MVRIVAFDGDGIERCSWAGSDPLMVAYHDREWGVPCHDDRELFERLTLEGFQAGLSWATILRKREHFRRAFAGFDPVVVASYDEAEFARLMADPGIVRNRLKVRAATRNARAFLATQAEHGSFDRYLWNFVDGEPLRHPTGHTPGTAPASTPLSDAISKDLRRRGFSFVGTTIVYAFMQSVGMVDDHTPGCFRFFSRTEDGTEAPRDEHAQDGAGRSRNDEGANEKKCPEAEDAANGPPRTP